MEGGENQEEKGGSKISNSIHYNPINLPNNSAPDRRINSTAASSRRGISIFSPTPQTLDIHQQQPYNINSNDPSNLNPHTHNFEYPTSDSDPTAHVNPNITISIAPQGGVIASTSRTPPPPPQATATKSAERPVIRYRECLKNHAANAGGHVLDGCGEFMPGGEEGSLEYLRCAACDCHRNFHRREAAGEPQLLLQSRPHHPYDYQRKLVHHRSHEPPPPHGRLVAPPAMMNFSGGGGGGKTGTITESSSEDLNGFEQRNKSSSGGSKKRFRTKFSQEQKDKMQEFASKLNWTIQRQNDQEVMRFCNDVGVKRQVFKVWMHNNKQAMKRKSSPPVDGDDHHRP